jgi:hypothetical protein
VSPPRAPVRTTSPARTEPRPAQAAPVRPPPKAEPAPAPAPAAPRGSSDSARTL